MEDRALIKGRRLKIFDSQKKKMIMPDVILHTENVMIPVVRPMPTKQSFNIPFSEDRPQILKAQNYRNKPALLFLETPSHTLHNLGNLFQVKRAKHGKSKNQSTKYTISEKIDFTNIEKNNVSRDSLSCKKKDNTLNFPNTILAQFKPFMNDKELHKASSKFIQLSRKCNLSQIKGDQIKVNDEFTVMPRIEMPISNIMNKAQIVSSPNESFYDIVDTVSTVSTMSVPSINIENKNMFANIENRKKLISRTRSDHLHPSNSEYEINVLHYENDILPRDKFPYSSLFDLNSPNTNWPPTGNFNSAKTKCDNEHFDKKSVIEESYQKWDTNKATRNIKYSWEAVDGWVPPSKKKEYNNHKTKNFKTCSEKSYDCKVKYSWQVIGTSTQTSYSLLQDLLNDNNTKDHESTYKICNVKYSWQIIGMSTQASLHDCNDPDYWSGILLTPNKNYNRNSSQIRNNEINRAKSPYKLKYPEERLKRYLILHNQQTQTFAEKDVQADANDYYAKYSWHNLIKQHL